MFLILDSDKANKGDHSDPHPCARNRTARPAGFAVIAEGVCLRPRDKKPPAGGWWLPLASGLVATCSIPDRIFVETLDSMVAGMSCLRPNKRRPARLWGLREGLAGSLDRIVGTWILLARLRAVEIPSKKNRPRRIDSDERP